MESPSLAACKVAAASVQLRGPQAQGRFEANARGRPRAIWEGRKATHAVACNGAAQVAGERAPLGARIPGRRRPWQVATVNVGGGRGLLAALRELPLDVFIAVCRSTG